MILRFLIFCKPKSKYTSSNSKKVPIIFIISVNNIFKNKIFTILFLKFYLNNCSSHYCFYKIFFKIDKPSKYKLKRRLALCKNQLGAIFLNGRTGYQTLAINVLAENKYLRMILSTISDPRTTTKR